MNYFKLLAYILLSTANFSISNTFFLDLSQYKTKNNNSSIHARIPIHQRSSMRYVRYNPVLHIYQTPPEPKRHVTHNSNAELHSNKHFNQPSTNTDSSNNHSLPLLIEQWQQDISRCCNQTTKDRLTTRINALTQNPVKTNSPPIRVSHDANTFAQQYCINLNELVPKNAPAIAHTLYQEYVNILDAAAHIPKQHNSILADAIGEASHIGLQANNAGYVDHASKLADFCWTILDYTKAVGEGIYLGATSTLHTLTHPIETVQNSLLGIGVITHGLVSLTDFMHQAPFLFTTDNDQFFIRLSIIQDQLESIANAATTYLTSNDPRDIVRDGTAFITEGFLFGKIASLAGKLTKQILPLAAQCIEYITIEEPLVCLADGELIPIKMPKSLDLLEKNALKVESKQISNLSNKNASINQAYELNNFKSTRKPILEIKHPVLDNIRTGSALKLDAHHAFHDLIDNFVQTAERFSLKGQDGILRDLYQIEGSLNGIDGVFEWIVDPRPNYGVTHRLFIKDGKITGKPNVFKGL